MTKSEAFIAMKDGLRVTHRYFLPEEYIWMMEDHVFDELDSDHGTINEFFFPLRMSKAWEDGWSIYDR